uniref:NADH-ubiquinone oxidoreductase chain 1 n=1 Tax=Rhodosoma turcicum TaxID=1256665 RepID=S0DF71_9ASCI|nr:NADH dehydrogenase subunit 1 [Rhodosoma turcicum]CCO25794.1 NADH dehydrogenase subunit 1 [Rhodosoma turcicum]
MSFFVILFPLFVSYLVVILSLLLLVAFLVLFERNILGLIQIRKGPNTTGIYGVVQTVMDGVKLLMKEMVYTSNMRLLFFFLSPVVAFAMSLVNWLFIFFPSGLFLSKYGVLITLGVSSLMVYTILWAGWGSNAVFSLVGGVRAVAQMISYEVCFGLLLLGLVLVVGSYSWESFFYYQVGGSFFWIFFSLLVLWGGSVLAELNRTPFDLVEGESELVGGFNVEYAGYGFVLLFLSEYVNIWFMGMLTSLVFFFPSMMIFFVVLSLYCRGALPRFKFTDLIMLTWKVYLPIVLGVFGFIVVFICS